ncbi:MAG: InlB B-repeat-containing protein, partial [Oscillibacter sp.]|nr:InlB B-repeat-containing protein [Oscillibacter sp.]
PGGGLLGKTASGVTTSLNFVYVVAPVEGVAAENADLPLDEMEIGAVTGVSRNGITNTQTFYLPEVYSGYTAVNGTRVRTSGTLNIFSKPLQLAYYDRSDVSNIIAARSHEDTMEIKTYPYDRDGLKTSGGEAYREYPFSIWTTFSFEEGLAGRIGSDSGKTYGVYYGDWQPILPGPTVKHTLRFLYADTLDNLRVKPVSGDNHLTVQEIQEGKANKVLLPYVAPVPGWRMQGWTLTDQNGNPVKENGLNVVFPETKGYITIPAQYCLTDRYVTALFERNPNEFAVSFVYDPSGQNRYGGAGADYERIGRVLAIQKGQDNTVTVPSRTVDGYLFQGWYTDAALTAEAFPVSDDYKMTIPAADADKNYTFYARYEQPEYELVTLDFLYQTADGKLEAISSVPVFQVDDAAQYQIQTLKGQAYSGWVKLPATLTAYTPLRLLDANKLLTGSTVDTEGAASIAAASDTARFRNGGTEVYLNSAGDSTRHYAMLYEYGGAAAKTIRYTVKFELAQSKAAGGGYVYDPTGTYTYQPEMDALEYPESAVPQPSLDSGMFQVPGFRAKSYSHTINSDNSTGVLTVKFVRRAYTLSFDTGDGSYVPAKTVTYGAPLSQSSTVPTRQGYTFDSWATLYRTGRESETLSGWSASMPAYNVTARAKWNPANVNYTVLFWYENANDTSESFMGSVTRTALTGSTVTSDSFRSYAGVTGSSWIDTQHFTYDTAHVETETVKPDGSTIL